MLIIHRPSSSRATYHFLGMYRSTGVPSVFNIAPSLQSPATQATHWKGQRTLLRRNLALRCSSSPRAAPFAASIRTMTVAAVRRVSAARLPAGDNTLQDRFEPPWLYKASRRQGTNLYTSRDTLRSTGKVRIAELSHTDFHFANQHSSRYQKADSVISTMASLRPLKYPISSIKAFGPSILALAHPQTRQPAVLRYPT